eukprot:403358202
MHICVIIDESISLKWIAITASAKSYELTADVASQQTTIGRECPSCENNFCAPCVKRWEQSESAKFYKTPCKCENVENLKGLNKLKVEYLQQVRFNCQNRHCLHQLTYDELLLGTHELDECNYIRVMCEGCGMRIFKQEQLKHESVDCENPLTKCRFCQQLIHLREILYHTKCCPQRAIVKLEYENVMEDEMRPFSLNQMDDIDSISQDRNQGKQHQQKYQNQFRNNQNTHIDNSNVIFILLILSIANNRPRLVSTAVCRSKDLSDDEEQKVKKNPQKVARKQSLRTNSKLKNMGTIQMIDSEDIMKLSEFNNVKQSSSIMNIVPKHQNVFSKDTVQQDAKNSQPNSKITYNPKDAMQKSKVYGAQIDNGSEEDDDEDLNDFQDDEDDEDMDQNESDEDDEDYSIKGQPIKRKTQQDYILSHQKFLMQDTPSARKLMSDWENDSIDGSIRSEIKYQDRTRNEQRMQQQQQIHFMNQLNQSGKSNLNKNSLNKLNQQNQQQIINAKNQAQINANKQRLSKSSQEEKTSSIIAFDLDSGDVIEEITQCYKLESDQPNVISNKQVQREVQSNEATHGNNKSKTQTMNSVSPIRTVVQQEQQQIHNKSQTDKPKQTIPSHKSLKEQLQQLKSKNQALTPSRISSVPGININNIQNQNNSVANKISAYQQYKKQVANITSKESSIKERNQQSTPEKKSKFISKFDMANPEKDTNESGSKFQTKKIPTIKKTYKIERKEKISGQGKNKQLENIKIQQAQMQQQKQTQTGNLIGQKRTFSQIQQ